MRAVDVRDGKGDADALFFTEIETPQPQTGEVLVKVKAFGLNRMDVSQREGSYPVPPQAPKTLGVEFSGTVEQLGGDVKGFKKGDKVFGLAYGGAYAEYIKVSQKTLIHMPDNLSWEKAAAIPETWITATQALWQVGCFKAGDKVLVHTGASGVGIAAIQLAKCHGAAAVFTTVSSQEKIDFCVDTLGATAGFNYRNQDFAEEILKATGGKGVDVIIDAVGQSHIQKDVQCAARDGRIVLLSFMSGYVIKEFNIQQVLLKRLRIEGSTLRSRDLDYIQSLRDRIVREALQGIKEGKMKVFVEKVLDWNDISEAHKLLESNKTQGKIICTIN